jgi:hypothetical protein
MNRLNLKQTIAVLGAASISALMGLPVLAQSTFGNGVANPNPNNTNELPSRSQTNGASDRCAGYVNGGVGGPTNNSSPYQSNQSNSSRSSDDTAARGVQGSTNSNTNTNQFPNESNVGGVNSQTSNQSTIGSTTLNSNNSSAYSSSNGSPSVASRVYGPAGTTGREAAVSVDSYASAQTQPSASNSSMNSQMMNSQAMGGSMGNRADYSQFSANNRYPAVAHRTNGPAGTTGREATVNIDDFIARNQNSGPMAGNYSNAPMSSNSSSSNSMSSNSMSSNTNTASIPVECAPR